MKLLQNLMQQWHKITYVKTEQYATIRPSYLQTTGKWLPRNIELQF
jgi:hypothetical protein